jgi:CheY-like chemotaxis protein
MTASLEGVRVLLVEDEYLVASLIEEILEIAGCVVTGPIPRLAQAVDAADREACDAAVLDVNFGRADLSGGGYLIPSQYPLCLCHRVWRVARRIRQSATPLQAVQDGRLARHVVGYRQNCAGAALGPLLPSVV